MFSVIIPVYNRKEIVSRAINSVLKQSCSDFEIIVIDDGSDDGTPMAIRQVFKSKVVLISQEQQGVSAARNLGIKAAKYQWLAFLDSDDEWLPTKLQRQEQALAESGLLVCHTNEIWIRDGIRINQCKHHAKSGGDIFLQALPRCIMSPSSVVIHKTVFDRVGMFDESYLTCEDYELFLRVTANFQVTYVDERLIIKYGGHSDQLSHAFTAMDRFRVAALDQLLRWFPDLEPGKKLAAQQMLLKKAKIVLNGATRRNNQYLIAQMQNFIDRWENP